MLEKAYGASVIGRSHIKNEKPNQDYYLISNNKDYTLAVVCDGLGSKKYSHIGSKKLCKVIRTQIKKCYKKGKIDVEQLLLLVKKKWKRRLWPVKVNDADTTCIFVVISKKSIIMCQIGDGLCVLKTDDKIDILSIKDNEFSNETMTFYKSRFCDWKIRIIKKEEMVKYKLLLCSDGISEDLKNDMLSEFIDKLGDGMDVNSKTKDNEYLLEIINNWPNKYSNDDKTMVVIK